MPTPKKSYSFTLNNYTEDELAAVRGVLSTESQYAVVGREVGEGGTPHLQGYVRFKKPLSFKSVKDRLNPRSHVEISRGSPRQNREYCTKDGEYDEYGECPNDSKSAGGRTAPRDELGRKFAEAAHDGRRGIIRYAEEYPGSWYHSGHNLLRNYWTLQAPPDRESIVVRWYHGRPGVGKSRRAHEELPGAYVKEPRTKWWNGYLGEKEVIVDDFGPNGIDINHLLRWFDRYKCMVENKGGMQPLCATNVIVTSNFTVREVYTDRDGVPHPQIEALERRVSVIMIE
jgi:hypothetical protein